MTIHNDNNIKAVAEFAQAYSERLQSMYNGLKGIDVFCVDIDWDNIPQEFSKFEKKDFDSPYSTDVVNGMRYIFRSAAVCANYSTEEEIALISHEFGHIILESANIKLWHKVMDEIFCDNIAHSLDLSDHIIAALDTMSRGGYDNVQEIADRKAIAETVKVCKDNLPQTDPMSTLNSFFNVAIPDLRTDNLFYWHASMLTKHSAVSRNYATIIFRTNTSFHWYAELPLSYAVGV